MIEFDDTHQIVNKQVGKLAKNFVEGVLLKRLSSGSSMDEIDIRLRLAKYKRKYSIENLDFNLEHIRDYISSKIVSNYDPGDINPLILVNLHEVMQTMK